jgi:hypothetical protein
VQNFDFLGNGGIADGGILESIAKGFIENPDMPAPRELYAVVRIPVVNEFGVYKNSSEPESIAPRRLRCQP